MSNGPIRPSTIDGIKRYAKSLKTSLGITHARALDLAANAGGFHNFAHALRALDGSTPAAPGYLAFISVPWRMRETKESGQEILTVHLAAPLNELVKPGHLKALRFFGAFKLYAADHLNCDHVAGSQSRARRDACEAARALTFMEATGLRPSAGRSRCYPRGDFGNAVPGHDHHSEWFDPATKAYVYVDEPYKRAIEGISPERQAWALKHGWMLGHPKWLGMYNPDGGCELYLAADAAKGFDMDRAVAALNALPTPFAEANWDGHTEPMWPVFQSPASQLAAARPKPEPKPLAKRSSNATVGYRTLFGRSERRRPAKRMPIEGHMAVGRLLKAVIYDMRGSRGIYKPLDGVRCDLDDWVQCEYNREELSSEVFFDLYYHEDDLPQDGLTGAARAAKHAQRLDEAKGILARHYSDCAPLRALFKAIDKAGAVLAA